MTATPGHHVMTFPDGDQSRTPQQSNGPFKHEVEVRTTMPTSNDHNRNLSFNQSGTYDQRIGDYATTRESLATSEQTASLDTPISPVSYVQHLGQGNNLIPNAMPPPFESAVQYDYSTFDQPLNWIPVSVYPSPYDADLEQDFSFFLPTFSESSGMVPDYDLNAMETPDFARQHSNTDLLQDGSAAATAAKDIPPSLIGPAQSPAASSASNDQATSKSVAGSSSASEARKKRRKSSFVPEAFKKPSRRTRVFAFPDCQTDPVGPEEQYCSQNTHGFMLRSFQMLCVDGVVNDPFATPSFPGLGLINQSIVKYFEVFHPICPLVHQATCGQRTHWLVLLAIATIGSTFLDVQRSLELAEAFQEFLRRSVDYAANLPAEKASTIPLFQARILNLIGLTMSARDALRQWAPRYHADLSRTCQEAGMLQITSKGGDSGSSHEDFSGAQHQDWQTWIEVESMRRIAYYCWLLDTALAYLANSRPLFNLDDARAPLPCPEEVWNCNNLGDWKLEIKDQEPQPSLCAALEDLYAKKSTNLNLSDFCQILLINALFQRTWEVGTHIKQPLSEWVPTGKARGFLNTPSKDNFWLPLYPLYANWRNSACDCLDIINWQAASTVAKASGIEHNLMLHLHLARIILLTPFQEIQDLLLSLIGRVGDDARASFYVHDGSYQPRNRAKLPQIRKITWRWLREDQHKARLAMVHAGSVFWHVRRYSHSSFYEPVAVYLASLVLWTYGSYKSSALERDAAANANAKPVGGPSGPDADLSVVQPSRVEQRVRPKTASPDGPNEAAGSESDTQSDSEQPEFIHLDRPCDDEMVQHFVRNGHHMSGHMSNVGDICKTPQKVLLEGAKLLRTRLGCWGVSREYHEILMKLAELRKAT